MNIRALNEPESSNSTSGESSDEEGRQQTISKEALEDQCFDKYKRALIAIHDLKEEEAKCLLEELSSQLGDLDTNSETLAQLKFSVLKNLGNLKTDDIDNFLKALEIDPSDISLWIKTGERSLSMRDFFLARLCYEQALNLSPSNWVAMDRLMELYYILHLPFELYDICSRALSLNRNHKKASELIEEAKKELPNMSIQAADDSSSDTPISDYIRSLRKVKLARRAPIQQETPQLKRPRLSITLDTSRTQSLSSFGNYIIKIYERFSKQSITRNTIIDITLNNSLTLSQQLNLNNCINSQSLNQNSSETASQDIEMSIEGEALSASDNDKSNNRNEQTTTSNEDNDQNKSNSRNRLNQTFQKSSSLSFAAMLFPMDSGDKRRSSRNKSNQDDTYSFKMKFDELNDLLPENLRIGAIEEALRRQKEEQKQRDLDKKEEEEKNQPIVVETNLEPVREDIIIKEIIEAISNQMTTTASGIKTEIKLCDMFYLYLSKISSKKQNTPPEVYTKIYKVYRKLSPLPKDIFIDIGPNGVTLDEFRFTLTANEILYNKSECLFMLRFLDQLQLHLDDNQHKEFVARLFLILGLNLDHGYLEAALSNIEEDARVYASNRKIITRAYLKTMIDRNKEKMLHDSEIPNDSLELVEKLAPKSENEMSDREITSLCNAIRAACIWQRGLDILNQRNDLNNDIIIQTLNACLQNGAKMDAILASKLCKEAVSGSRPTTWTCLYYGWLQDLDQSELNSEHMIERLDKFFEIGHQTLGKKCTCTSDSGEFLMLYVKHLLSDDRDGFEERELLGCLSCLFNYPNKKPAAVVSHKAVKVPMKWQYAKVIYDYFAPEDIPTYMCLLRKRGLSGELVELFKEIAKCVPPELNPEKIENAVESIENFILRGDPLLELHIEKNDITKNLFYFLADYHFKNKYFEMAKTYYYFDLAINPLRFDSWAASGLILANGVDKALSEGKVTTDEFVDGSFKQMADSAIRCFQRATELNPNEAKATLWIEFGNLTYNLVSLASRLFCYDDFELELEDKEASDFSKLEDRHKHLYSLAKNCFESAITLCQSDEVWLQYYMLGKIYEKVDPLKALELYFEADAHLFHEGAKYPTKILYHNPPELAFEAMEVHYRIHTCALKYLLTSEEITQENMNLLRRFLLSAQRSPFVILENEPSPMTKMEESIADDVNTLLIDIIECSTNEAEFDELIFMCLHGMHRCLIRSDKNFKALFRLSYYYKKIRDPLMAQQILWGQSIQIDKRIANLCARKPGVPHFRAAPPILEGIDSLFKDRKMGNIFYNVWRMPAEEVDRPGCFEHWMFKCTWLLIKICIDLSDTTILSVIAFQLHRQPETSKKYMQDRPRVLLGLFATKSIAKIIFEAVDRAESTEHKIRLINEGLMLADRFIKANVFVGRMQSVVDQLRSKSRILTLVV